MAKRTERGSSGPKWPSVRAWRDAADDGVRKAIENARRDGARRRLSRLLPDMPHGAEAAGLEGAVRERLEKALRAERRRGQARHWTYDFNRHLALLQALASLDAETAIEDQNKSAARIADGA